jgi:hypothetical protein
MPSPVAPHQRKRLASDPMADEGSYRLQAWRASLLPVGSQFFLEGPLSEGGVPHAAMRAVPRHSEASSRASFNFLAYIIT